MTVPEDTELEPVVAADLFGEHIDAIRAFTAALATHGEERGLIGPMERPRLWNRHILNSGIAAPLFSGRVADVGSGAGLPGIVLAIARPDVEWVLIEPMERRVAWLTEQVAALGLTNVEIIRERAERTSTGPVFDVVTARAVSALKTLIPTTAPLVRPGGQLVFLKGANVAREVDAARAQIRSHVISDIHIDILGEGVIAEPTRVFRATVNG